MSNNRKYNRIYSKLRRASLKDVGLCTVCGKVEPEPGFLQCSTCRERKNEKVRAWPEEKKRKRLDQINASKKALRDKRKAAGICTECGLFPAEFNHTMCEICLEKKRKNSKLYYENHRQKPTKDELKAAGICYICGGQIEPGNPSYWCLTCRQKQAERMRKNE